MSDPKQSSRADNGFGPVFFCCQDQAAAAKQIRYPKPAIIR